MPLSDACSMLHWCASGEEMVLALETASTTAGVMHRQHFTSSIKPTTTFAKQCPPCLLLGWTAASAHSYLVHICQSAHTLHGAITMLPRVKNLVNIVFLQATAACRFQK
eukprot:GHRQ01038261.1.p2 GENE.GHRQ01038261.1~~GHRQ01038261.1.p2  ORF type:complete len:109 (-),score=8.71 GHRQ01038261.1:318-644(-)